MRPYNSDTDYPIVLEACRQAGQPAIAEVAHALRRAGIRWPGLQANDAQTPSQAAMDAELRRAWRELGYAS